MSCLKILGLQEMLKLSEVIHSRSLPLKQVSGGGFIVGDAQDERPKSKPKKEEKEAKVIPFPQKQEIKEEPPARGPPLPAIALETTFLASEEILNQLEIAKEMSGVLQKHRALEEYKQGQNVHMVKSKDSEGKTQVRFAKTKGVLIDRKLA